MALDFNDPETKKEVDAYMANTVKEQVESQLEARVNDAVKTQVNEKLADAIEHEVNGLKNKNSDLIREKKTIQDQLDKFKGIDAEKIHTLIRQFEDDEEARLISEGKIDEVIAVRTERMRKSYDQKQEELSANLTRALNERDDFSKRYDDFTVEVALRKAAEKHEVLPEAIDDVLRRAKGVFAIEEGNIVSKTPSGKVKMNATNDGPYTPGDYIDELKSSAAYYWPASKGLGASGGAGGMDKSDLAAALQRAAESGDMKTYREIREKQKKASV